MTLAKQVIATASQCRDCFSLYAGYGMVNGEYLRFPQGVQLSEKRNAKGRCTKAIYQYADGSKVTFTYSEQHGSSLRAN